MQESAPPTEAPPRPSGHTYMRFIARNGLAVLIELNPGELVSRAELLIALRHATDVVMKMPAGAIPTPQR